MVTKEAEERIIKAASLLVRAEAVRLVEHREPDCRGSLRLGKFLDSQTRIRVIAALNGVAADLAEAALEAKGSWGREEPPKITQRMSVLSNELPCSKCGKVRRVAIHDIKDGEMVAVECEICAPEFRGT